jgi:hypothetical protein
MMNSTALPVETHDSDEDIDIADEEDNDDLEVNLPTEVTDLILGIDPMVAGIIQRATGIGACDDVCDTTRYQINKFYDWMKSMLELIKLTWNKEEEPCPVYGLLIILEISGTEKGQPVHNCSVNGCGHSLSQLERIQKFVSKINEENGFTKRLIYPSNHSSEYLRGETMNSAHHSLIIRCMKKYRKKISRREIQAQPFLRYHLIIVRKKLMEKGIYGLMIYTGILVAFWLCIRVGVMLTIRIENIEIGTENRNEMGLPIFLKVRIKMQKTSNTYKIFRLWCYALEDVEVCPVFHLMLLLKTTGWRDSYLFRKPLSGAMNGDMIMNYSQCNSLTREQFYSTYNREFQTVFFDTEYKCSCHGPRRSMAQLMDRMGFSLLHIMAQCLWKNPKDAMKYVANSRVDMELLPEEHRREFPKPKPVHI